MCDGLIQRRADAQTRRRTRLAEVQTQRVENEPAATIFTQGDLATSVMYVEKSAVPLSVLSHAGREAMVACPMQVISSARAA